MNKIMILATFHMETKNDRVNFQGTDSINEHETEIMQIVDALAAFKPTQIAVEYCKSEQSSLDATYLDYIANGSTSPNEINQIAFRLAKNLGHEKVYAIDWMERGAAERPCGEVQEYLYMNQPELACEIDALIENAVDLGEETIREAFLRLNSKASVQKSLAYYMNYARIGSEEYYGNGWLIWWYQRNLNIFTNTAALVEGKKEERVLLIIGAAHKGILEQFFENSRAFEVVNSLSYLEK